MAQKQLIEITQKVADTATVGSAIGFGITLADVDTMISIVAGVAAIVSALAAAYYYISKTRREENGNGTGSKDS